MPLSKGEPMDGKSALFSESSFNGGDNLGKKGNDIIKLCGFLGIEDQEMSRCNKDYLGFRENGVFGNCQDNLQKFLTLDVSKRAKENFRIDLLEGNYQTFMSGYYQDSTDIMESELEDGFLTDEMQLFSFTKSCDANDEINQSMFAFARSREDGRIISFWNPRLLEGKDDEVFLLHGRPVIGLGEGKALWPMYYSSYEEGFSNIDPVEKLVVELLNHKMFEGLKNEDGELENAKVKSSSFIDSQWYALRRTLIARGHSEKVKKSRDEVAYKERGRKRKKHIPAALIPLLFSPCYIDSSLSFFLGDTESKSPAVTGGLTAFHNLILGAAATRQSILLWPLSKKKDEKLSFSRDRSERMIDPLDKNMAGVMDGDVYIGKTAEVSSGRGWMIDSCIAATSRRLGYRKRDAKLFISSVSGMKENNISVITNGGKQVCIRDNKKEEIRDLISGQFFSERNEMYEGRKDLYWYNVSEYPPALDSRDKKQEVQWTQVISSGLNV